MRAEVEDERSHPQTRRTSLNSPSFVLRPSFFFFLTLALYISFCLRLVCGCFVLLRSVRPSVIDLASSQFCCSSANKSCSRSARRLINSSSRRSCLCFCSRLCYRGLKYRTRGIFGKCRPGVEMRGGWGVGGGALSALIVDLTSSCGEPYSFNVQPESLHNKWIKMEE